MDEKKFFNGFDDDILDPEDFEEEDDDDASDDKEGDEKAEETDKSKTSENDDQSNSDVNEEEEDDEEEEEESEAVKKAAEAEKNAKFAAARRAKEAREREDREKRIKEEAKIEAELGMVKVNPFTEQPIKDKADLEIYKVMKEIDDAGGDAIADFPKKMAEINRAREAQAKADAEREVTEKEKIQKEIKELREAHPDVNLNELSKNQEFLDLCEQKEGRWTMLECYEYLEDQKATKVTKDMVEKAAKKVTKVPSSKSSGGNSSTDYMEMTDEEYLKLQKSDNDFF